MKIVILCLAIFCTVALIKSDEEAEPFKPVDLEAFLKLAKFVDEIERKNTVRLFSTLRDVYDHKDVDMMFIDLDKFLKVPVVIKLFRMVCDGIIDKVKDVQAKGNKEEIKQFTDDLSEKFPPWEAAEVDAVIKQLYADTNFKKLIDFHDDTLQRTYV